MCGIVGCFGKSLNFNWINTSLSELKHRGPDSQIAVKSSSNCFLGSARLAMTDPSSDGNQPFYLDGDWLVFNGEIYNHEEIRDEFFSGHFFKSHCDTEVLGRFLQTPELWNQVELNGPYAFAFFDHKSNRLTLGRDDSGKKPLYFRRSSNSVFFSSDQTQLALNPSDFSTSALIQVLSLGYVSDPESIFSDVQAVSPGKLVTFEIQDRQILQSSESLRQAQWPKRTVNQEKSLRHEILGAVERRVNGHDKVALSLSGGIDSTVISICLNILNQRTTTYSVMWPDADKNRYNKDAELAKKIAEQNGQLFVPVSMVSADEIPQVLDKYISLMGEPNCNPSGLSMMSLYERAKSDGQRLMLTGDGADELFFGYDRYKIVNNASKIRWIFPLLKTPILREISTLKTLLSAQLDNFNDWAFWHQNFSAEEIETLFGFSKNDIQNSRTTLENTWNEVLYSQNKDRANLMMELDRRLWLKMESNKRLDRVSMAYSIEARCPFQDRNIIELAFNANIKGGVGKRLAKADLIRAFPELDDLRLQERKVGFISPLGNWIRVNKKYVEQNLTYLAETGFTVGEFHNNAETQEGLANGDFSTLRKMWTLLVVSRWLQTVTGE